jgi:hypothetical protein
MRLLNAHASCEPAVGNWSYQLEMTCMVDMFRQTMHALVVKTTHVLDPSVHCIFVLDSVTKGVRVRFRQQCHGNNIPGKKAKTSRKI